MYGMYVHARNASLLLWVLSGPAYNDWLRMHLPTILYNICETNQTSIRIVQLMNLWSTLQYRIIDMTLHVCGIRASMRPGSRLAIVIECETYNRQSSPPLTGDLHWSLLPGILTLNLTINLSNKRPYLGRRSNQPATCQFLPTTSWQWDLGRHHGTESH